MIKTANELTVRCHHLEVRIVFVVKSCPLCFYAVRSYSRARVEDERV
jgi:hypothetical protein